MLCLAVGNRCSTGRGYLTVMGCVWCVPFPRYRCRYGGSFHPERPPVGIIVFPLDYYSGPSVEAFAKSMTWSGAMGGCYTTSSASCKLFSHATSVATAFQVTRFAIERVSGGSLQSAKKQVCSQSGHGWRRARGRALAGCAEGECQASDAQVGAPLLVRRVSAPVLDYCASYAFGQESIVS